MVTAKEFMDVYNMIVEQCDLGNKSTVIYDYVNEASHNFMLNYIVPRIAKTAPQQNERGYGFNHELFVQTFAKVWEDFTLYVKLMERAFEYMNRNMVQNHAKTHTSELSFFSFKQDVFFQLNKWLSASIIELS